MNKLFVLLICFVGCSSTKTVTILQVAENYKMSNSNYSIIVPEKKDTISSKSVTSLKIDNHPIKGDFALFGNVGNDYSYAKENGLTFKVIVKENKTSRLVNGLLYLGTFKMGSFKNEYFEINLPDSIFEAAVNGKTSFVSLFREQPVGEEIILVDGRKINLVATCVLWLRKETF